MIRKIFKIRVVLLMSLTVSIVGCDDAPKDAENEEVPSVSSEPLIVETDEPGYAADLEVTNTIPTQGLEDGTYEGFYPNGELQVKGLVVDGKRSGLWTSFHPAGNKQSENSYVKGKLEDKTVVYYPSGQIMYIGYYSNGENDGQWLYFDQEGTLVKEVIYDDGEIISSTDKNEKPS